MHVRCGVYWQCSGETLKHRNGDPECAFTTAEQEGMKVVIRALTW